MKYTVMKYSVMKYSAMKYSARKYSVREASARSSEFLNYLSALGTRKAGQMEFVCSHC
jgi:hypothetical protein